MEQIKISAKNLGQVGLDTFCPKCYWIKLKVSNKLPYQIFPGIFNSIAAYTEKAVHFMIDRRPDLPSWLKEMGDITGYRKVPHWRQFSAIIEEYNILLAGVPDDLLLIRKTPSGTDQYIIPDYKTSKYTETQKGLFPMYEIQLNSYAVIAVDCKIEPVVGLYLVYMEPITDEEAAMQSRTRVGFSMGFKAYPRKVEINPQAVYKALETTRMIYDLVEEPEGREGCQDCANLGGIIEFLS